MILWLPLLHITKVVIMPGAPVGIGCPCRQHIWGSGACLPGICFSTHVSVTLQGLQVSSACLNCLQRHVTLISEAANICTCGWLQLLVTEALVVGLLETTHAALSKNMDHDLV